jgi:hypothetical protein
MVDEKTEVPSFIFLHPFLSSFPEQTHNTAAPAHPRGLKPHPKRCAWARRGATVSSTACMGLARPARAWAGWGTSVSGEARASMARLARVWAGRGAFVSGVTHTGLARSARAWAGRGAARVSLAGAGRVHL